MRPLADADPTVIGSYRLLGVLGNGGMGRVYMGQSRSGRPVAIKVIRPDLVDDPVFRRRFAREVAAVREVNPLFTAAVVDSDLTAEAPWLATTYIEGPSLERWVEGHGALSPGAVLTLAAGLAEALASIHAVGLVHRDLKPSNVLLGDVGPYIIDFGVVLSPKATRMTASLVVGTPSYMAPERIHGGEATPATDIFSLGATMYYAATARTLVDDSDTVYAQMMHIVKARFDLGRVPSELRPMIMRCLSADQRDRPTAAELSRMLAAAGVSAPEPGWHQAISDVPFSAVLTPRRIRRTSRRRLLLAGGLVGLATAGGVAAGVVGRYVRAEEPARPGGGALLWQGRSGAEPVAAGYGAPAGQGGGRPAPAAVWLVPLGSRVMAGGRSNEVRVGGEGGWARPVPDGLVSLHRWGGSLLIAGGGSLTRLTPSGDEEFRFGSAGVRRVAVSGETAFVGAATLTALGADGSVTWQVPGGGTPLHADRQWVLTHDRLGDRVRIALYRAATGAVAWDVTVPAPAVVDEDTVAAAGPPPGEPPDGRPPPRDPGRGPGGPGGPGGGPPPYSHAWNYTQAVITDGFVVVRDASDVRALKIADGGEAWALTSKMPVTDLALAGDRVLVAAERVRAHRIDTGDGDWTIETPGARVAVTPRRVIVATPDGEVSAHEPGGDDVWRTQVPDEATGLPDRVVVDGDGAQVFVTLAPPPGGTARPDVVDVVALAI